jgi:hypothetical protein
VTTRIVDGKLTYLVTVKRPDYIFPTAERSQTTVQKFQRVWVEMEGRFGVPTHPFRSEDWGHARNLCRRYPIDRLRELLLYWYRYSYENAGNDPLRWFMRSLPVIEREMGTEVHLAD